MYKVIKRFKDLQDKNHVYNVGDIYPRDGFKPSLNRLDELSSAKNKRKQPLIQLIEEKAEEIENKAEKEIEEVKKEVSEEINKFEEQTPVKKPSKKK